MKLKPLQLRAQKMSQERGYKIYTHYDFDIIKLKEIANKHDILWERLAKQWFRYNPNMNGAPIAGAGFYVYVLNPLYKVESKLFLIKFYQKECMRWEATRDAVMESLRLETGLDIRYCFGRVD